MVVSRSSRVLLLSLAAISVSWDVDLLRPFLRARNAVGQDYFVLAGAVAAAVAFFAFGLLLVHSRRRDDGAPLADGPPEAGVSEGPPAPVRPPVARRARVIMTIWLAANLAMIMGSAATVLWAFASETPVKTAGLLLPLYMSVLSAQSYVIMRHFVRRIERFGAAAPTLGAARGTPQGLVLAMLLTVASGLGFAGGWAMRAASTKRPLTGWSAGPHRLLPGRTIHTCVGAYEIFVATPKPRVDGDDIVSLRRDGTRPRAGTARRQGETAARNLERGLVVNILKRSSRPGGVFSLDFRPRGWHGTPMLTLGTDDRCGHRTHLWTLLSLSGGLAIRSETRRQRLTAFYRLGGQWAPLNEITMAGHPRGTTMIWRGGRYCLDPRAGYWVPRKSAAPQTQKPRGAK